MMRTALPAPMAGLLAQVLLIATLAVTVGIGGAGLTPAAWAVGIGCAVVTDAALAGGLSYYRAERLRPADWVTLLRATLSVGIAALVADSFAHRVPVGLLVTLTVIALALDAVDGWVARRTGTSAALGAQFDGEVDAFLLLVLSVYVARSLGAWVLAIGVMRYAFLVAGWVAPWMRRRLPRRSWRKVVTAAQGIALATGAAGVLGPVVGGGVVVVALGLLSESFGRDVLWLWGNRHGSVDGAPSLALAGPELPIGTRMPGGGSGRERSERNARRRLGVVLSTLAAIVVWAALVAPDQPQYLTPDAFARLPLEGLALIGLALVLPPLGRRIMAGVVGPVLALLVIVKVLNFGFFTTFDRPFDPIGDSGYAGIGIETLRASIGRTEANLVIAGVVVGVVALVALTTISAFAVIRAAARHRRRASRVLIGLGGAWALCWVLGAQLIAHTPIASTLAAGLIVDEVRSVQADINDESVFAAQIRHDSMRNTPAGQLLTGLRGKDVLLVFVEAYGQRAVQGSTFSPGVDAVLDRGTRQLTAAGFSTRSAFLSSATFGGISWLAHSTLQSGVWVNSQRRYNQLMSTDRFTLSDAFHKAGWRTVDDVPSNDRFWSQGASYYHYDKVYDRRDVGYRGPTFTYASMPDQYVFAALSRLELARSGRAPLFAEVDTVSSHMPWNRIPQQIPWSEVGDGSIYKHVAMDHETGAFWSNPTRVKAAYGRSIQYAMSTLVSFVTHSNDRNLVLVVLGDHQPLPIVSGHFANHDVPISIIARDPAVMARIGAWRWGSGLRPAADAPVWPMDAFRDRFLRAFDSSPPAQ